jgi:hypothetical protein
MESPDPSIRGSFKSLALFTRDILLPLFLTRALLIGCAMAAVKYLPAHRPPQKVEVYEATRLPVRALSRFDSMWYLSIARDGYSYTAGKQSNVAQLPLFPWLMRWIGNAFGGSSDALLVAGVLIANGALIVAMAYFAALVRMDFDEQTASRAVLYLLVYPMTYFLSAVYPMSLIVAISVSSFYYARKQRWWLAGLIAAFAPLARPDGILLSVALLLEYLYQINFSLRLIRRDILPLGIPLLALLGWMTFLYVRFRDPIAFVTVQSAWRATGYRQAIRSAHGFEWLSGVALFALAIIASWRWLRPSYALFGSLFLVLLLFAERLWSFNRYALVLFPAFIIFALAGRNRTFDRIFLILGTGMSVVYAVEFALWHFIG